MSVYEKLYDVVQENMKNGGGTFGYRKTTFLCDIQNDPQVVDVSKYLALPNPEFYQAVFVTTFKRLPEEKEEAPWRDKFDLPVEVFQKEMLLQMAKSSVVAINHIRFVNNPYFEQRRGIKYRLLGSLYGLTDKSSLREFGKKMPQPIQKIIRKVFL